MPDPNPTPSGFIPEWFRDAPLDDEETAFMAGSTPDDNIEGVTTERDGAAYDLTAPTPAEMKRDPQADLEACELAWLAPENGTHAVRFFSAAIDGMPVWIRRAVAAEAKAETHHKSAELITRLALLAEACHVGRDVQFTYTNHADRVEPRTVNPRTLRFKATEFYEKQWVLEAWCGGRGALRDFAVAKMEDLR